MAIPSVVESVQDSAGFGGKGAHRSGLQHSSCSPGAKSQERHRGLCEGERRAPGSRPSACLDLWEQRYCRRALSAHQLSR